jgi:hypothetical protein
MSTYLWKNGDALSDYVTASKIMTELLQWARCFADTARVALRSSQGVAPLT